MCSVGFYSTVSGNLTSTNHTEHAHCAAMQIETEKGSCVAPLKGDKFSFTR